MRPCYIGPPTPSCATEYRPASGRVRRSIWTLGRRGNAGWGSNFGKIVDPLSADRQTRGGWARTSVVSCLKTVSAHDKVQVGRSFPAAAEGERAALLSRAPARPCTWPVSKGLTVTNQPRVLSRQDEISPSRTCHRSGRCLAEGNTAHWHKRTQSDPSSC